MNLMSFCFFSFFKKSASLPSMTIDNMFMEGPPLGWGGCYSGIQLTVWEVWAWGVSAGFFVLMSCIHDVTFGQECAHGPWLTSCSLHEHVVFSWRTGWPLPFVTGPHGEWT